MASVKSSQPVQYANGLSNKIPQTATHSVSRNAAGVITVREDYDLSDSDIDGLSTNRSIVANQSKPEPECNKTLTSNSKDDTSLVQWIMQQFQQNASEHSGLKEQANGSGYQPFTPCRNGDIYSGSQVHLIMEDAVPNRHDSTKHDQWSKSCCRLDNVRTAQSLHYPRMQRSRETSLKRPSINPVDSVNHLLDEINRKAEDLKSENDRINQQLQKATAIISHLKYTQQFERIQARDQKINSASESYPRYESSQKKETPVLKFRRLNNTKMNSVQSLLTRSAYPDAGNESLDRSMTQISESKTPTIHRLRSENRFIVDDRLPQSPPSAWKGSQAHLGEVRLREAPATTRYPITRRYSSTHQTELIRPRDEYRESSLGPLNSDVRSNGGSNSITNTSGASSKFSWLGRALSQLSLADWSGRSKSESKSTSKTSNSPTPDIYGNLSPQSTPTKGFSTTVRRPFRRKATSPGPGPVTIPSPIPSSQNSHGRCISLVHLNSSLTPVSFEVEDQEHRNPKTHPDDFTGLRSDEKKHNLSFIRKFVKEQSIERLNRQDGLPSKDRGFNGNGEQVLTSRAFKRWLRPERL